MATQESQQWLLRSTRGVRTALILVVLTTVSGTAGFILLEGYNLIDAFYMTVITLSTTGFGEVKSLSPAGKIFTSLLIMAGVVIITFSFSHIIQVVVEGELYKVRGYRKMRKSISSL